MSRYQCQVADEDAMVTLGERLGKTLDDQVLVFLEGELGAGKTTLSRGVLRSMGHHGAVKSPTYTLVEPYTLGDTRVYHFDLYRLGDPEELEFMGIRDYFQSGNYCLVEWPERGEACLPKPDLRVCIKTSVLGREVVMDSQSDRGESILSRLNQALPEPDKYS